MCEPGEAFEFAVVMRDRAVNTWRYEFRQTDKGGTDVTESFALAPRPLLRLYWALLGWTRGKTNRNGMRTTLERIKTEVEATPAP